jgi:hypothetical protein
MIRSSPILRRPPVAASRPCSSHATLRTRSRETVGDRVPSDLWSTFYPTPTDRLSRLSSQPHMHLAIRGVSKTHGNGVRALRDVTLDIPSGMYGLLGPGST